MKKFVFILLFTFLAILTACKVNNNSIPTFSQDRWSYVGTDIANPAKDISVLEQYNGYTYQQSVDIALSYFADDPYYELVWGTPTVISPDGSRALYCSNKADLTSSSYAMMMLDISSESESVLFQSDSISLYPLWWVDNNRFVYEKDGDYYISNIAAPAEGTLIHLEGAAPYIWAYNGTTFIYSKDPHDTAKKIAKISDDNIVNNIAAFEEDKESLMAESAISESLHLAVFKNRVSAASFDRDLIMYDYQNNAAFELLPPDIENIKSIYAIDFFWSDTKLIVNYEVDNESQYWAYQFE